MLSKFRKSAGVLAVVTTAFAATHALAESRTIVIVEGDYFPALTHVEPGDELVFYNNTTVSHTVTGAGDVWTSGAIPAQGRFTLLVDADTPETFSGPAPGDATATLEGAITFEPAPAD
ncbi:hypothetical protein HTT03_11260 [Sulfitobacter sp. S0837]|uniref:hypothetical protein n=1 Tax=Sulfitobacter maritimus TaxID=2741719 RepID=UPI001583E130|nr:hypothetical protein [Sulfitobacter maritimus]NUH65862.1 hypothetical protein [Sulfitobacter maritimus]